MFLRILAVSVVTILLICQSGQLAAQEIQRGSLKPLDELGSEQYQGFSGGFYPDGRDERPAVHEQAGLAKIVQVIADRFPNVKLCYLSSRTYGGFATTGLNPEPYAYESGFAVKWLIEEQLQGSAALNYDLSKGDVRSPWLSWGPYLWANGAKKRTADGLSYEVTDFSGDGTHHSPAGSRKVGQVMLEFFRRDTTTKGWFNRP